MKKITCVVDNAVRRGSPFWGEHGLAFRIETDHASVLFDTGHTESVLWHNLALLGGGLCEVSALILSHAHTDHTGALAAVLSQRPGLPLYASPDVFRPRFSLRKGIYKPVGLPLTQDGLEGVLKVLMTLQIWSKTPRNERLQSLLGHRPPHVAAEQ